MNTNKPTQELSDEQIIATYNVNGCSVVRTVRAILATRQPAPESSQILDPMYRDKGQFKTIRDGKNSREYDLWQKMRARCYKHNHRWNYPTYEGCAVSPEFHSFQAFAAWATKQIGFAEGFSLDKDLLKKGNRIYSAENCVFVPVEINNALNKNRSLRSKFPIGVRQRNGGKGVFTATVSRNRKNIKVGDYKTAEEAFLAYKAAKEGLMKELAEKYKAVIDPRAYAALMAYQVEITD